MIAHPLFGDGATAALKSAAARDTIAPSEKAIYGRFGIAVPGGRPLLCSHQSRRPRMCWIRSQHVRETVDAQSMWEAVFAVEPGIRLLPA